ncbi:3-keto-disaccharide hydrolase [Flagellimonas flava]|uniref:3-keto-disaccharide hydrolase n=1 Tax=Flagellimonas flava TaxID=570519 RepID=UPI003D64CDF2
MKKQPYFLLVIVSFLLFSCNRKEQLFNENVNDWFEKGDATWSFDKGELVGTSAEGSGFVMTNNSYKDFSLELEFYPDSTINSGVFLRCKEHNIDAADCHEINIWDLHPNQDFRTGAVVTKAVPLAKVTTLNQWNTYKIKNQDDRVQVWVNDTLTVDLRDDSLVEGFIGLQAAGKGKIKFRNVTVESLD